MTDFIHMVNIIQGEVIRITERRPLEEQPAALEVLIAFLRDQAMRVTVTKLQVVARLPEGTNST